MKQLLPSAKYHLIVNYFIIKSVLKTNNLIKSYASHKVRENHNNLF